MAEPYTDDAAHEESATWPWDLPGVGPERIRQREL